MKRYYLLLWALTWPLAATATPPQVPSTMWLADVKLQLTPTAKSLIQKKVNQLMRSPQYFQKLLDRVNLFAPIIEKGLNEEAVPLDFRYVVIQESALVSDAVSTSNAVGFWQFKDFTAREVGLKINEHVDERMHITMATRGAARYLKRNNQYLNNWVFALLAYCTGRGHVERNLPYKKYQGVKKMRLDGQTHYYLIHFLAHKLVFEDKIGQERHPELHLHEYQEVHGKTLHEIATEVGIDKKQLQQYNKWVKRSRVPHDATCSAIIPMTHQQAAQTRKTKAVRISIRDKFNYNRYWARAAEFPVQTSAYNKKTSTTDTRFNGLLGTLAQEGATVESLAQASRLDLAQFLAINDLAPDHHVVPGQVYYYQPKNNRAGIHFHIAQSGETWWSIAQKYGIQKVQLLRKNRLRQEVPLRPGRVLWLRFIRPANIPTAYEYKAEEKTSTPQEHASVD